MGADMRVCVCLGTLDHPNRYRKQQGQNMEALFPGITHVLGYCACRNDAIDFKEHYTCLVFQKFQDIEENHILHMKDIIQSYSQSVEETHVQIGEVSTSTRTCTRTVCYTFLWVEWVSH